jgi:hypothetical protein
MAAEGCPVAGMSGSAARMFPSDDNVSGGIHRFLPDAAAHGRPNLDTFVSRLLRNGGIMTELGLQADHPRAARQIEARVSGHHTGDPG